MVPGELPQPTGELHCHLPQGSLGAHGHGCRHMAWKPAFQTAGSNSHTRTCDALQATPAQMAWAPRCGAALGEEALLLSLWWLSGVVAGVGGVDLEQRFYAGGIQCTDWEGGS